MKLLFGDCLELMQNIPDGCIDAIITDLPYGGVTKNKWDVMIPFEPLWEQYNRIIKPNGAICLFADGLFMAKLMLSNEKMWRYNLVWDKVLKSGFLNAKRMPLRQTEEICVFYKKQPTYNPQKTKGPPNHTKGKAIGTKDVLRNNNYGSYTTVETLEGSDMKYPTSILSFSKPHPSIAVHPTEKPVELLEWLIKTYTNEGETVLDSCMGSGSTGVACKNTNRHFIGMELTKENYDIACKRINTEFITEPA